MRDNERIGKMHREKRIAIQRIEAMIEALRDSTNEFDIEAKLYAIYCCAESAYKVIHTFNSVNDRRANIPANVFERIFQDRPEDI